MEQEKRFSVRFPESVLEEIKQAAHDDKRSINQEIVWLVQTALEERKEKQRLADQQENPA